MRKKSYFKKDFAGRLKLFFDVNNMLLTVYNLGRKMNEYGMEIICQTIAEIHKQNIYKNLKNSKAERIYNIILIYIIIVVDMRIKNYKILNLQKNVFDLTLHFVIRKH